jgi:hypothetical protein
MSGIRLALALLLASAAVAPSARAQELGRLFFTPEQRATLDARRKARLPDKPAAATVESPTAKIDGYVRRRGGKSTVWLNGEAIPEGSQPEGGVRVLPQGSDPSRVSVSVGESERQVDMKIGESLDRGNGEVRDVIGNGEIRIRPGGARTK